MGTCAVKVLENVAMENVAMKNFNATPAERVVLGPAIYHPPTEMAGKGPPRAPETPNSRVRCKFAHLRGPLKPWAANSADKLINCRPQGSTHEGRLPDGVADGKTRNFPV